MVTKSEWLASRCQNQGSTDNLDAIATSLQADYDRAIMRLSQLEAAAERVAGFAGHDWSCTLNRFPNEGACSCGYTAAYRLLLDKLGGQK